MEPEELAKLKQDELAIRQQELDLKKAEAAIEFAKFGFRGTLKTVIVGMICFVALVAIQEFGRTPANASVLIVFALSVLVGCVSFGYFSLNQLPQIALKIMKQEVRIGEAKRPKG